MRAVAKILRARASDHLCNFCEEFEQRPNFASTFKSNGTIPYPFSDLLSTFRLRALRYCSVPLGLCNINRPRFINFIIFHGKRKHNQGPCTVNVSQHCTFVSGVSQTCAWIKHNLTLIIFVKGNRSPDENKVTWSVPGCQGMSLNGCWMKSFIIDVFVIQTTRSGMYIGA